MHKAWLMNSHECLICNYIAFVKLHVLFLTTDTVDMPDDQVRVFPLKTF